MAKKKIEYIEFNEMKRTMLEENPEFREFYYKRQFLREVVKILKDYREKNNLTQVEVAEKLGLKQQNLSRLERGKVTPTIDTVFKILFLTGKTLKIDNLENTIIKN